MPKSKSPRVDRTKRNPRDPNPERAEQAQAHREREPERDGVVVEELDEFDTDKYEPAPRRE